MVDPFDSICYRTNFLKEVIARVDLINPLPGVIESLPVEISKAAVLEFPIPEPRESIHRAVQISPEGLTSSEEKFKEWHFHGKERTKSLTIARQVVLVQYTAYQTYEVLKSEFVRILDRVAEVFQGIQTSRVGLRYVNSINLQEPQPIEWSNYLAPELLSLFHFPSSEERLAFTRVFHNIEFAFETFSLRFRFGMHNPDFPARIRQKIFILDLDAYTEVSADIRSVGPMLNDFHTVIQRYFEKSITEQLRGYMNVST